MGCNGLLLSRLRPATLTMMSVLLTFAIALVIEGGLGYLFSGTQRRIQLDYSSASLELLRRTDRGGQADRLRRWPRSRCSALYLLLKQTRFGQALRATIQHREAAQLLGIDTDRIAGFGFGLGLATAAVGGTALALDATIYPSLHWHWIGPLMAIIVIGGLGSIPGAAIAAMVLGVTQSLLQIPTRHHLGADGLLPRPVRHLDGPSPGILRRSSCPALLSTRKPHRPRAGPSSVTRLVAAAVALGLVLAFPRSRRTRSSCRSAS